MKFFSVDNCNLTAIYFDIFRIFKREGFDFLGFLKGGIRPQLGSAVREYTVRE